MGYLLKAVGNTAIPAVTLFYTTPGASAGTVVVPVKVVLRNVFVAEVTQGDDTAGASVVKLNDLIQLSATTFEVTHASRTTTVSSKDGHEIHITDGDVIGLMDDDLIHAGGSSEDAVMAMLSKHYAGQEIITVFSGASVTAEQQQALAGRLGTEFPAAEVEAHTGGPDLYDYLVTME